MSNDSTEPETRASLLAQLRGGTPDQAAWGLFVERYDPLVQKWCRDWGLQPADADDVSQVVLLKLAGHLQQFRYDPDRRFRGFLRTVAHNAWRDFLADRARGAVGTGDTAVLAALQSEPARDDLAARVEEAFDRELLAAAEARVRRRVEPHTWEAFRLTAMDELSGADAAARLGMQVGAVFKARSKVQKMLREELKRLEAATEGEP
ncbi:RNA polymerase sigma factor [Frigoriglobus tundricola]|uniref:Putative RNA polymerase sigma factor Y n=1 Tax=Frigoriglobus tundricola TaxID=2774151 RepID=A0A6M5YW93_9BACT|nr:sigma-70 family RNA polymerase sigma factor [Frigoriglobus tundricola]QJW98367.1 putative RNA polymerase sigma factor Y [Frigoriglobus tundricola]